MHQDKPACAVAIVDEHRAIGTEGPNQQWNCRLEKRVQPVSRGESANQVTRDQLRRWRFEGPHDLLTFETVPFELIQQTLMA